jgi:hypothetical protein
LDAKIKSQTVAGALPADTQQQLLIVLSGDGDFSSVVSRGARSTAVDATRVIADRCDRAQKPAGNDLNSIPNRIVA